MSIAINYIKKINWRLLSIDLISGLLLLVFLYTAWSKPRGYEQFRYTLSQSYLLKPFANVIAWSLPVAELVVVLLLFIPAWRRWGLWTSAILYASKFSRNCGGVVNSISWGQHIVFHYFFLGFTILAVIKYQSCKTQSYNVPP